MRLSLADVRRAIRADDDSTSSDYDLNPEVRASWPASTNLRPAAVLVPLIDGPDGRLDVILTKRASHLKHHPGQIAFPGGKVENGETLIEAAIREAHEEIALLPDNVEILGEMPYHQTVTSFRVTPVVAKVRAEFQSIAEPGEVAEVFRVPLDFLADRRNYLVEGRFWGGQRRLYYTVPYGPYYIWGATARMLLGLQQRLIP